MRFLPMMEISHTDRAIADVPAQDDATALRLWQESARGAAGVAGG